MSILDDSIKKESSLARSFPDIYDSPAVRSALNSIAAATRAESAGAIKSLLNSVDTSQYHEIVQGYTKLLLSDKSVASSLTTMQAAAKKAVSSMQAYQSLGKIDFRFSSLLQAYAKLSVLNETISRQLNSSGIAGSLAEKLSEIPIYTPAGNWNEQDDDVDNQPNSKIFTHRKYTLVHPQLAQQPKQDNQPTNGSENQTIRCKENFFKTHKVSLRFVLYTFIPAVVSGLGFFGVNAFTIERTVANILSYVSNHWNDFIK